MLTVLYSLGRVVGAEIWLGMAVGVLMLCVGACLLLPRNRSRKGLLRLGRNFAVAGAVCDAIWFVVFYSGGDYQNPGLGGAYCLLLWPALMIVAGIAGTIRNKM